ncbi:DUF4192 domain-containing protein [Kitasatospora sp. NPDC052896]|uniref:DUF4192 domain-containing protein n=1 Tax=Kitasatospora sp. NPDC052896 TaxID=3364061 RepID=UPI0037C63E94
MNHEDAVNHEDPGPIVPGLGHLPGPPGGPPVRMRGPADMAAMLPYLLGFYPDDSIVAVGLQGPDLRQGGVIRLDIPDEPRDWPVIATEAARLLVELSEDRDRRPRAVLLYLCRDPKPNGPPVLAGLRPLAAHLLRAFRALDLPVKESLCVSEGRWWSFLCADPRCCDPGGFPVRSGPDPGPAVTAATFAGLAPRGSRKAIAEALAPIGPPECDRQRLAFERQLGLLLVAFDAPEGPDGVLAETGRLIDQAMAEFADGTSELDDEQAARLILGLQDRAGRDRAAEYAEPAELACAQRLWRFLARRCVPPYEEYAAAPLTLLAWTAWLAGDTATSRVVLARALDLDPGYALARLLYGSLNGGLRPDRLLATVRVERARRLAPQSESPQSESPQPDSPQADSPAPTPPVTEPAHPGLPGPASPPGPAPSAEGAHPPAKPPTRPSPPTSGSAPATHPRPSRPGQPGRPRQRGPRPPGPTRATSIGA